MENQPTLRETTPFQALVVRESEGGKYRSAVETRTLADLPPGEVLIKVAYSSLNYKDALSATGNKGVTRKYPHTPGIDAAGIVVMSGSPRFRTGDAVIVTGRDLGMNTAGGFGQYIRVPADYPVNCPPGLSLRESMIWGTAGFTAAQSVLRLLQEGCLENGGEVLVTGATGGVGSLAVLLLSLAGFRVTAATGKIASAGFLKGLGAQAVVHRDEILDPAGKPLLDQRWAGVVDTVGGGFLSAAIRSTRYGGCVTCCGLTASPELPVTVFPFILRAVSLVGINSEKAPMDLRLRIWGKFAGEWKSPRLDSLARECDLQGLGAEIDRILKGEQVGRVVVRLD